MRRRVVVSLVLGVVLVLLQLLLGGATWPVALLTGLIGAVVAYLVLLVSDRWFDRAP